jgi:hypothetical protein
MDEPDYDTYTLEELQHVYHRINSDRYPERFERVKAILNDPVKIEKLKSESSYQAPKSLLAYITEFVTEVPFWLSIIGLPPCIGLQYYWLSNGKATMRSATFDIVNDPVMFWFTNSLLFLFCMGLLASFVFNTYQKFRS